MLNGIQVATIFYPKIEELSIEGDASHLMRDKAIGTANSDPNSNLIIQNRELSYSPSLLLRVVHAKIKNRSDAETEQ